MYQMTCETKVFMGKEGRIYREWLMNILKVGGSPNWFCGFNSSLTQ
jgi:hypothetical protein